MEETSINSDRRSAHWEHIYSKHPIICAEYILYKEFESAFAIKFLGYSSTDTCKGDTEICIKDMAYAHFLYCDNRKVCGIPIN